jgi:HIV Tat-specific factor 1
LQNKRARNGGGGPQTQRPNTAVYVTNLPFDATADEVHELFSRKAGVVAEEIDSGRPRIKMYTDPATGAFKGEALVVFFKPQSVDMAIMLLDDTPLRPDTVGSGVTAGRMRVMVADASYKKVRYDDQPSGSNDGTPGAETPRQPQDRPAERSARDKQKIIKKTQKLAAKLADWSDDEDPYRAAAEEEAARAKWDKMVVLRHMFTLDELAEDEDAFGEIRQDVLDECEKLGPVTKVTLYDLEPDGVITVKFRTPLAARACIELMHGRNFAGRTVEATIATGGERFKKTPDKKDDDSDSE